MRNMRKFYVKIIIMERVDNVSEKIRPLEGKSFLSMNQLDEPAIMHLIEEAKSVEQYKRKLTAQGDIALILSRSKLLSIIMREPSTRAASSMERAMTQLGGSYSLNDIEKSSEAKGETITDTWLAFASNCDVLGIRTPDDLGPHSADKTLVEYHQHGKLDRTVPVINLGDGTNEHPTQALGDLLAIHMSILNDKTFKDMSITMVGDHEKYRAFHSLIIGAKTLGMTVKLVESPHAKLPQKYEDFKPGKLIKYGPKDLVEAIINTDVLYIGRNPEEYAGVDSKELKRARKLKRDYQNWQINQETIDLMSKDAIILHPRPRGSEMSKNIDFDQRVVDVAQMHLSTNMRMAILAQILGHSIRDNV